MNTNAYFIKRSVTARTPRPGQGLGSTDFTGKLPTNKDYSLMNPTRSNHSLRKPVEIKTSD
jgi:hypothetical protein